MLFCIRLLNLVQIKAPTTEIWRYIHFSRWRPRRLNTTFGVVFVDVTAFRRSKSISKPNFVEIISIGGWDITTSGLEIQTSAILDFYFRFWSRPVRRNLRVILYQVTEFRPNQSTQCGNMTSYPFLKMAAATAKYYFRFRIFLSVFRICQKVKVYQQTKFRRDISIGGWDITTPVSKYKRLPYWNSTSGFDLDQFAVICMLFCMRWPNIVQIGAPNGVERKFPIVGLYFLTLPVETLRNLCPVEKLFGMRMAGLCQFYWRTCFDFDCT